MNNKNHESSEVSLPSKNTSILGTVSIYIGITSYTIIAMCIIFLFYQATKPCKEGYRCEGIPFFELLFVLAVIFVFISLLGGLLAFFSPKNDTEKRIQKREQGLNLNFSLFGICLFYILFILIVAIS